MPFTSGTVSYARFRVVGGPTAVTTDLLDELTAHVLAPPDPDGGAGPVPEIQAGWVGGRHIYDEAFEPAEVVYGGHLLLGMRVDTNRVPAEVRRAHRVMATAARTPGRDGAADARDDLDRRCREEVASGRHRRSRLIPVWWDVEGGVLCAPVFSDAGGATLRELMRQTFDADLEPVSAGGLARAALEARGRTRDYDDLMPSSFTPPPLAGGDTDGGRADAGGALPAVPWSVGGPEPKDFLGNEFLLWLWWRSEGSGQIDAGPGVGAVAVAIDRTLDMECAWEVTGRQMLRASGPARLPEAGKALQIGKWPRKAGLLVAVDGEGWTLTFQADRFLVTGARLPRPSETPASPREDVEARLASLVAMDRALTGLFRAFLEVRTSDAWSDERSRLRAWITERTRGRAPSVDLVGV
ncbi:MAG: hypothetical protein ACYTG1_04595 [Planctomycetota bacterium]